MGVLWAMGLQVVAIDVDDPEAGAGRPGSAPKWSSTPAPATSSPKCERHPAEYTESWSRPCIRRHFGRQSGLARAGGTIVFNGLPGDFPAPIFDIVLKGR